MFVAQCNCVLNVQLNVQLRDFESFNPEITLIMLGSDIMDLNCIELGDHYSEDTFYYLEDRIRAASFLLNAFTPIFRHFTEKNHYVKDGFRRAE